MPTGVVGCFRLAAVVRGSRLIAGGLRLTASFTKQFIKNQPFLKNPKKYIKM